MNHSIRPFAKECAHPYCWPCPFKTLHPMLTGHFTAAEMDTMAKSCVFNFNLEFKSNRNCSLGLLNSSLNQWNAEGRMLASGAGAEPSLPVINTSGPVDIICDCQPPRCCYLTLGESKISSISKGVLSLVQNKQNSSASICPGDMTEPLSES